MNDYTDTDRFKDRPMRTGFIVDGDQVKEVQGFYPPDGHGNGRDADPSQRMVFVPECGYSMHDSGLYDTRAAAIRVALKQTDTLLQEVTRSRASLLDQLIEETS